MTVCLQSVNQLPGSWNRWVRIMRFMSGGHPIELQEITCECVGFMSFCILCNFPSSIPASVYLVVTVGI